MHAMPKKIAVLDLGSTSFSLAVFEVAPKGRFKRILRKRITLRLGAHINRSGAIPESDCLRATEAVRRLRIMAADIGCETLLPVGTAIFRNAGNARELTARIEDVLDFPVRILSGEEEARLSYTALHHRLKLGETRVMVADLGGGSLELAVGIDSQPQWLVSLPIGVTRLHAEWVHTDLPSKNDARAIRDHVRDLLIDQVSKTGMDKPLRLAATGGTIRALARLALAWRKKSDRCALNGMTLTRKEIETTLTRLVTATHETRLEMPTVQPRRADLLPVGGLIVSTLLSVLAFDEFVVSDWGLREGILLEALKASAPVGRA